MKRSRHNWIASLIAFLLLSGGSRADCPAADETLHRVERLGLERSTRATRFEYRASPGLYERAADNVGKPVVERDGKRGFGVLVAELPIEQLWRAINDEDRHVEYTAVKGSAVVGGTPRGSTRLVFQYGKMFGFGRWWVSRIRMNPSLFRDSGGTLWEFWWEDAFDAADPARPPVADVVNDLDPIERTRGTWLLAPIGDGCTLVELFNWSEPGGAVGAFAGLALGRTLRTTLEGMNRLASEGAYAEEPDPPFVRPDGSLLDEPSRADGAAR